jgi:hypothetical protein
VLSLLRRTLGRVKVSPLKSPDILRINLGIRRQSSRATIDGLQAVEDAIAKGLLPTAVLGAVLFAHNQAPQVRAEEQGLY